MHHFGSIVYVCIRLHHAMYVKTRFTLIYVRVESSIPRYFFEILLTREPDSSSNRASSSDDSRFCTIANTRRKTRFPATTDITCKLYAFYRLESRSCSLLTMIGSNPTISDSFVRIRNGNQIARLKFGPCCFASHSRYIKEDANVYHKKIAVEYITGRLYFVSIRYVACSLNAFILNSFK